MTTHTVEISKRPNYTKKSTGEVVTADKINSVVFTATTASSPIVSSVYLNRPMVNGHTKAKLTIEFLD